MPRVVPEQKQKYENDETFRKLARESEVNITKYLSSNGDSRTHDRTHYWNCTLFFHQIKYTAYRDRSHEERVVRFQTEIRDGQAHIVSISLNF